MRRLMHTYCVTAGVSENVKPMERGHGDDLVMCAVVGNIFLLPPRRSIAICHLHVYDVHFVSLSSCPVRTVFHVAAIIHQDLVLM